jgi:hypothetical protein
MEFMLPDPDHERRQEESGFAGGRHGQPAQRDPRVGEALYVVGRLKPGVTVEQANAGWRRSPVLRQGLSDVLPGVGFGGAGAWYVTKALRGIVYGVESPGPAPSSSWR